MKKNMIGTLLLSTLLLGGLATPAFAEGQATSKGDITFTEPTNTVVPLDPTDPSKPVELSRSGKSRNWPDRSFNTGCSARIAVWYTRD